MRPAEFGYSVPVMGSNLRHGGRRRSALAAESCRAGSLSLCGLSLCGALIASMIM